MKISRRLPIVFAMSAMIDKAAQKASQVAAPTSGLAKFNQHRLSSNVG
ncbi:MAG: hypothetical protein ACU84Q_11925 [Gammaproteobacteria bacterium]